MINTTFFASCSVSSADTLSVEPRLSGDGGVFLVATHEGQDQTITVSLPRYETIKLVAYLTANLAACTPQGQAEEREEEQDEEPQPETPPSPGLKVGDRVRVTAKYAGCAPHDIVGTIRANDANDGYGWFLVEFAGWKCGHTGQGRVPGSESCWWVWPEHLEKAEPAPSTASVRYPHGCVVNIPGVGHRMVAHCWSQGDYVPRVMMSTGGWVNVDDFGGVAVAEDLDLPEGLLMGHRSCTYDQQEYLSIVEYLALVNPTVFDGMSAEDVKEMTMADGWWMKRQGFESQKLTAPLLEDQGITMVNHYEAHALAELLERRYS